MRGSKFKVPVLVPPPLNRDAFLTDLLKRDVDSTELDNYVFSARQAVDSVSSSEILSALVKLSAEQLAKVKSQGFDLGPTKLWFRELCRIELLIQQESERVAKEERDVEQLEEVVEEELKRRQRIEAYHRGEILLPPVLDFLTNTLGDSEGAYHAKTSTGKVVQILCFYVNETADYTDWLCEEWRQHSTVRMFSRMFFRRSHGYEPACVYASPGKAKFLLERGMVLNLDRVKVRYPNSFKVVDIQVSKLKPIF